MIVNHHTIAFAVDIGKHCRLFIRGKRDLTQLGLLDYNRPLFIGKRFKIKTIHRAKMLGNHQIKIIAAELIVARDSHDFNNRIEDVNNGNIQRSATEVKNKNRLILQLRIVTVQCRSARLVHNSFHPHSRKLACKFSGVSSVIVKISRNTDNRLVNRFAEEQLGVLLQPS